jgi:hypothetical protein
MEGRRRRPAPQFRAAPDRLLPAEGRTLRRPESDGREVGDETFTTFNGRQVDELHCRRPARARRKTARPAMKTAMIIARNTGQRANDIREFPWTK